METPKKSPSKLRHRTPAKVTFSPSVANISVNVTDLNMTADSVVWAGGGSGGGSSSSGLDILSSLRRQNEDLRRRLANMEETGTAKLSRSLSPSKTDITIVKACDQENAELRSNLVKVERLLTLERQERADTEKKSIEMLNDLKKKWQDREETRIRKLQEDLARAEDKCASMKNALMDANKILEGEKAEIEDLRQVKASLKAKLKECKLKLDASLKKTEEESRKVRVLEAQVESLEKRHVASKDASSSPRKPLQPLTPLRASPEKSVARVASPEKVVVVAAACKDCKQMREDLQLQKVDVRILERKNKELEERIKFLREVMIKEEKEGRIAAEKELAEFKGKMSESQVDGERATKEKEQAVARCALLERQIESLNGKIATLRSAESECQSAKSSLERVTRDLARTKEEAEEVPTLRKNYASMKSACLELQDQISEYESVAEKMEQTIKQLRERCAQLESHDREVAKSESQLKIEKNDLKSKLIFVETKLKETTEKYTSVETKYKKEEETLREKYSKLSVTQRETADNAQHLQSQLNALVKNFDIVSGEAEGLRSQNRLLKEELSEMKTDLGSLRESNVKLQSVMEEMLEKISHRNQEIAGLRGKYEEVAGEKDRKEMESNVQLKQLQKLVEYLKGKNEELEGNSKSRSRKRLAVNNLSEEDFRLLKTPSKSFTQLSGQTPSKAGSRPKSPVRSPRK